ncbi:hypothetical protein [Synechococcus sp. MIT S9508]|uniref:hypothetical protein n=1 Tax=Synechococcus sp. MIT S9508 TaxID=1801629 RepID=UPI0007BC6DB4|nr:hypothetical protein [Synechococcus sp. MIT S9508]KZR87116.1 hypothetical protein MITS9508_02583 [Synechococcus sp. MIT S9508]
MSFQSGLLGAAITLIGALSLSTPDVMQIHEVHGQRGAGGNINHRFNTGLLQTASADSGNICLSDNAQTSSKQGRSGLVSVDSGSVHSSEVSLI